MAESSIEWTGKSWNPYRGCEKISPGCKHCYAETFAERWRGIPGHAYEQGFDPREARDQLLLPLSWKKPSLIFTGSMTDLCQEAVSDGYLFEVFNVMRQASWHTFQVLTKRPERLAAWMKRWADVEPFDADPVMARGPAAIRAKHTSGRALLFAEMLDSWGDPPAGAAFPTYDWMEGPRWAPTVFPNVWLGTTVEDRKYGVPRIDVLRSIPATVRFLSIEPLLEDPGELDLRDIHWVIVGGESGNKARPFQVEWARSVRDQCRAAGVPVFIKQMGRRPQLAGGTITLRHKKGNNPNEWPEDLRIRQFPEGP